MQFEQIVIDLIRLGLFFASFFLIPRYFVQAKVAWQSDNHKQLKKSITFVWLGILLGLMAIGNMRR